MDALEQEAHAARMMVEASGKRAFVLIVQIDNSHDAELVRAVSEGTTRRDALAIIGGLNRERQRIADLIGIDPDTVGVTILPGN